MFRRLTTTLTTRAKAQFDTRALLHLGAWGACAAVALTAVVLASRSDFGDQRLRNVAAAQGPAPAQRPRAADLMADANTAQGEARRLAETVRLLTTDRDRLSSRLAALERNLDETTGSIRSGQIAPAPGAALKSAPPSAQIAQEPMTSPAPRGADLPSIGPADSAPVVTDIPREAAPRAPPALVVYYPAPKPAKAEPASPTQPQPAAMPQSASVPSAMPPTLAASGAPATTERPAASKPAPVARTVSTRSPGGEVVSTASISGKSLEKTEKIEKNVVHAVRDRPPADATPSTAASLAPATPADPANSAAQASTTATSMPLNEPPAAAIPMPMAAPTDRESQTKAKSADRVAPPPREPSATRRTVAATLLDAKSPQPPAKVAARATRVRHAARVTKKAASRPESSVATKTVFAVDLGGATTIDALRVAWTALKSNQNILVDGLQPLISVRDKSDAVELRLVVGPLANAALAARLCAAFASAGRQCEPAVFDGQRLTAN